MATYVFTVNNTDYNVEAETPVLAMVWMNRNVMDELALESYAWVNGFKPNTYRATFGNFFDQEIYMLKTQQAFPKRTFNPANKEDLAVYGKFVKTNSWGGTTCPFKLVWPFLNVPHMIATQIAEHVVSQVEVARLNKQLMSVYALTATHESQQSPVLNKGLVRITTSVSIYYAIGEMPIASSNNCAILNAGETKDIRFPVKCSKIAFLAVNQIGPLTILELPGGAKSSCSL